MNGCDHEEVRIKDLRLAVANEAECISCGIPVSPVYATFYEKTGEDTYRKIKESPEKRRYWAV